MGDDSGRHQRLGNLSTVTRDGFGPHYADWLLPSPFCVLVKPSGTGSIANRTYSMLLVHRSLPIVTLAVVLVGLVPGTVPR